jgi:hypothetical protein
MSQQPFQDIAAPQCDVVDAAEAGDRGIPGEIKGVCAESCGSGLSCARDWAEVGDGISPAGMEQRRGHRLDHAEPDHDLRLAPRRRAGVLMAGCAMCEQPHNRTSIFMLESIRPAHAKTSEEVDQPAEQGSNEMDDVANLAQLKAELSYLNRLDERRETNVASLKRLKEARDALLGRGSDVTGVSTSRRF